MLTKENNSIAQACDYLGQTITKVYRLIASLPLSRKELINLDSLLRLSHINILIAKKTAHLPSQSEKQKKALSLFTSYAHTMCEQALSIISTFVANISDKDKTKQDEVIERMSSLDEF